MMWWVTKVVGWKFFVAGAAAALIGERVARPAAVGTVKGGLLLKEKAVGLKNAAAGVVDDAKQGLASIHQEAKSGLAADATAPATAEALEALRKEIAQLREQVAAKPTLG
ncbi:hypothetical protein [Polyangium jinanense]|uniref:Uncharacterized protein n=1 Tax=Polyangium jinanense TaxID=2829994 RepID=A0A9X4AWW5_9BACT|nr:hypothetical protein [Polyangium jinanense]MDC3957718.1 hypothetical protein [Polyangium jinanense]MDC3987769.1 hypothetical protein [Polyangium jinanense]